MRLYFVSARERTQGFAGTVFAGHWLANSPREAITFARERYTALRSYAIDQRAQGFPQTGGTPYPMLPPLDNALVWNARTSKADAASMAENA
jgi:hypothetical protein